MDFESLDCRDPLQVELYLLEMARLIRERDGRATSREQTRILDLLYWTGSDEASIIRLGELYDLLGD